MNTARLRDGVHRLAWGACVGLGLTLCWPAAGQIFVDQPPPKVDEPANDPPPAPGHRWVDVPRLDADPPPAGAPKPVPAAPDPAPSAASSSDVRKLPSVPADLDIRNARGVIEELYADQLESKDPQALRALGDRLLRAAGEPRETPAMRFGLCMQVSDIAVNTGDLPLLAAAFEMLGKHFDVDIPVRAVGPAKLLILRMVSDRDRKLLCNLAATMWVSAAMNDQWDAATEWTMLFERAAAQLRDPVLQRRGELMRRDLATSRARFTAAERARAAAGQPAAALIEHQALNRGQWGDTVAALAALSAHVLLEPARADVQAQQDPQQAAAAAAGWWDAMQRVPDQLAKGNLARRAIHWYEAALPALTGLNKTLAEKRLAEGKEMQPDVMQALAAAQVAGESGPSQLLKLPITSFNDLLKDLPRDLQPRRPEGWTRAVLPRVQTWLNENVRTRELQAQATVRNLHVIQNLPPGSPAARAVRVELEVGGAGTVVLNGTRTDVTLRPEGRRASGTVAQVFVFVDEQAAAEWERLGPGTVVKYKGPVQSLQLEQAPGSAGAFNLRVGVGDIEVGDIVTRVRAQPAADRPSWPPGWRRDRGRD